MNSFIAIDVETANGNRTSICSVGAVKVEKGIITDRFYRLIRPYPNYYYRYFSEEIHGISRDDTDYEPTFGELWPDLKKFIGNLPLVAHNKAFDENVLKATARYYGVDWPGNPFYCTLIAARKLIPRRLCSSFSLPYLADFLGIPFDGHHNALCDAECCAKIALTLLCNE